MRVAVRIRLCRFAQVDIEAADNLPDQQVFPRAECPARRMEHDAGKQPVGKDVLKKDCR